MPPDLLSRDNLLQGLMLATSDNIVGTARDIIKGSHTPCVLLKTRDVNYLDCQRLATQPRWIFGFGLDYHSQTKVPSEL